MHPEKQGLIAVGATLHKLAHEGTHLERMTTAKSSTYRPTTTEQDLRNFARQIVGMASSKGTPPPHPIACSIKIPSHLRVHATCAWNRIWPGWGAGKARFRLQERTLGTKIREKNSSESQWYTYLPQKTRRQQRHTGKRSATRIIWYR